MSLQGLKLDADVKTDGENKDVLTGSRSFTSLTGAYKMLIDVAFMGKSKKGATSLNIHYKAADGSKTTIRQTLWVKSGDEKGNHNYYLDKDGDKRYLPDYSEARQITKITNGEEFGEMNTEEKTIKLYDFKAKAEVNTKVAAIRVMEDMPIMIGVIKVRDNKVKLIGGKYVDQIEDRTFNEVDKVFYPDGRTIAETNAEATEPAFLNNKWLPKFHPEFIDDRYVLPPIKDEDGDDKPDSGAGKPNLFADD
jgi:hypothetical protein